MLVSNNGVPNAIAQLGLLYGQVPLSIPNEEPKKQPPESIVDQNATDQSKVDSSASDQPEHIDDFPMLMMGM